MGVFSLKYKYNSTVRPCFRMNGCTFVLSIAYLSSSIGIVYTCRRMKWELTDTFCGVPGAIADIPFNLSRISLLRSAFADLEGRRISGVSKYPKNINTCKNDQVFVGRIRKDFTQEKTLNLWIVSDNLRKGAATNTVQIAKHIIKNNFIH